MSNLLSQASLVMIPSGYKEDVVYSSVPTNGNGDLSFTRASNGTRVNSAGLVEVTPWNLIDNSQTFSSWSKVQIGNTVTVTDNFITAPNGTLTAAKVVFGTFDGTGQIFANYTFSPTQNLTSTLYAKVPSGTRQCYFGFFDGSIKTELKILTTEWQRIEYTGSITAGGIRACWFYGDGGASNVEVHLWGGQVNVGGTAKPYFPTTDRLNVPRLTYQNGGGGCPSLLLEKQSTNELSYSEQIQNTSDWNKLGGDLAVTGNAVISPDGTQNAGAITLANSANRYFVHSAIAQTGGVTYTFSVYMKSASGNLSIAIGGVNGLPAVLKTVTTEWQRFTYTFTVASTTAEYFGIDQRGAGLSTSGTLYFWGAQVEQSSYPTSYIPTTSSSATRVADECSKTGISSLFGTNQGTFFIDFVYYGSEQFSYIFDVTDSANSNRFLMYDSTGAGLYTFYDSGYSNITTYQFTKGQRYKIAVKYNSSGTIWYVNGVLSGTGTVSFAHQMSQLYLGIRFSITDNTGMTVNESIVFPTALSGTELIALTTI